MQKPSENEGDGWAIKRSNRPGFYAKQGLVVLKMRMSLDQQSIYIYVYIPRPSKPWKIVGCVLITWLFKGCDEKTWFLLKKLGSSIFFLFYPIFTCSLDISYGTSFPIVSSLS